MQHTLKVLSVMPVTHNVHRIRFGKPEGYKFTPGQATDVSVNKPDWADEKRPFTFTCLNDDPYLEFTIKSYNDHDGVTKQIGLLQCGYVRQWFAQISQVHCAGNKNPSNIGLYPNLPVPLLLWPHGS